MEMKVGGVKVSSEEYKKAKEPYLLKKCALVRFARKSGKVDTMLEGLGFAMLHWWAFNNITKTKDIVIWCKETDEVLFYMEGREDRIPKEDGFKPGMMIGDLCKELAGA